MADTKLKKSSTEPRSIPEIEADLASARERLSRTVDELAVKANPTELKRRGTELAQDKVEQGKGLAKVKVEEAKVKAKAKVQEVKGQATGKVHEAKGKASSRVFEARGQGGSTALGQGSGVKLDVVAKALGGFAGVATLLGLARRAFHKG